jgi:hypothetical protein
VSSGNTPRLLGVAGATLLAAGLVSETAHAQDGRLLVFVHAAVKQRALQTGLQGALGGIEVTAVGRIADFERCLKEGTDAVLAIPPVIAFSRLSPALRGVRAGSTEEKYSIVGVGAAPDANRIASVGALDVLGRDGTNGFVHDLLGAKPRVERVSKVEDLLPLLQMQRVDAVLLPARLLSEIRSTSKLALAERQLGKTVALPAVAIASSSGGRVVSAVSKMPPDIAKILGVDSWR